MATIHLRPAEGNTGPQRQERSSLNRRATPDPDGTECLYSTAKRFSSTLFGNPGPLGRQMRLGLQARSGEWPADRCTASRRRRAWSVTGSGLGPKGGAARDGHRGARASPGRAGLHVRAEDLQILGEKGHVRHESEGRAYRYYPAVAPEDAGRTALWRIVDKMFRGAAEMALARLVEERRGVRGGVMTLTAWMLYSVAITVLLGGAAWLLELGFAVASRFRVVLRRRGIATRYVPRSASCSPQPANSCRPPSSRAARPMVEEFRMRRCYPPAATMFGGTDVE